MADPLERFAAQARDGPSERLFEALHRLCDALVGVRLFTCSRVNLGTGTAERVYTNDQAAYPLTGCKEIVANRWTKIVLDDRQPFLAETAADLRDIFPDHEKIAGLGLGATINLPVFLSGTLLGTVNLLDADGSYGPQDLTALQAAHLPAIIAFQALVAAKP